MYYNSDETNCLEMCLSRCSYKPSEDTPLKVHKGERTLRMAKITIADYNFTRLAYCTLNLLHVCPGRGLHPVLTEVSL